jgi:hypothetical protein
MAGYVALFDLSDDTDDRNAFVITNLIIRRHPKFLLLSLRYIYYERYIFSPSLSSPHRRSRIRWHNPRP